MGLAKNWLRKVATLYEETDVRRHIRMPAEFEAILNGCFGTLYATAVDINRDGIGVKTTASLQAGTLIFLKLPSLGLMGFANVRHCSDCREGYYLGLKFREPLSRDRETDGFECQRLRREAFRDWNDTDAF